MRVSPETPIGVTLTLLRKERDERNTAIAILEALIAQGVSPSSPVNVAGVTPITTVGVGGKKYRAGKKGRQSVASAALAILRAAGRPMHGLREIVPALEAQGYKLKHKAVLATTLMRSGDVERTAPGTFMAKGGAAQTGS
jgi:hypothetical protein